MNKIIIFSLSAIFIFATLSLSAQTVQQGVVKEYNEKAQKTPLTGVELNVRSSGSTVSDQKGEFSLSFPTLNAGDRITVRSIQKDGYEIFNKEALEQWNLNPNSPFTIVMCRSDKFKAICDNYYSKASANYKKQYDKESSNLRRLKEENKLKDEEYLQKLTEIQENYDRQLDNLDNYVDRFARIDLSELKEEEQKIIELVQDGRFDEAIAKYEELNISAALINTIDSRNKKREAAFKLNKSAEIDQKDADTMYETLYRQIETLGLAGGYENNLKAASLLTEIADKDTINIELQTKTGEHLEKYLADYDKAMDYYQMALASSIARYGKDHPETAICYINIGSIYDDKGDYNKALECYTKALEIREQSFDKNSIERAEILNNIGTIYKTTGDFAKALEYFEESLDIKKMIYGTYHPQVALAFLNIGSVYDVLAEYSKAIEYYTKTYEIYTSEYGTKSLEVALTLNNFSTVYSYLGDYTKALECAQEALNIREQILGENHPTVAVTLNNMGEIYSNLMDYNKCLECHLRALKIKESIFGESHPDVAISLGNMGSVYDQLDNYPKALECHFRALEIKRNSYGDSHPSLGNTYNNIANVYYHQDDYAHSIEYYNNALSIIETSLGADHPNYASSLYNIGMVYRQQKDYTNAFACLDRVKSIYEKNFGEEHTDFATALDGLGLLYMDTQDYAKSVECFKKAYDIFQKILGENHYYLAIELKKVGKAYLYSGDYANAIQTYHKVIDITERNTDNENASSIKDAYLEVGYIYETICKMDDSYKNSMMEYLSDKMHTGIVVENTPASEAGLSGEYYILEYEDWKYLDKAGLIDKSNELQGKPKTIVLLNDEGISKHSFENTIGIDYSMRKLTSEEMQSINQKYQEWKSNEQGNEI